MIQVKFFTDTTLTGLQNQVAAFLASGNKLLDGELIIVPDSIYYYYNLTFTVAELDSIVG